MSITPTRNGIQTLYECGMNPNKSHVPIIVQVAVTQTQQAVCYTLLYTH